MTNYINNWKKYNLKISKAEMKKIKEMLKKVQSFMKNK